METEQMREYYLGLDIGTDSVGYAATDYHYNLVKYHGEPAWGVMTFEAANPAQDRRTFRAARRRLDRRQQRVKLLEEIFASEICKIDPRFFIRRKESFLCRADAQEPFCLFSDDRFTDKEYSRRYPTIHHLIVELMTSDDPHDIRLVFHACAWLVAHRGHFLFDIPADRTAELLNFNNVYRQFCVYFETEGYELPWKADTHAEAILAVLRMKTGIRGKEKALQQTVYDGKKIEDDASAAFSRKAVTELLCGRKVKPKDLFPNEGYDDVESVSLSMDDEEFAAAVACLDDHGELLRQLRALTDCAMLISTSNGKLISEAKVDVYEQHKRDLAWLKYFVKKYMRQNYNSIFRYAEAGNYVAYSGNVKSCPAPEKVKRAKKDAFADFLKKKVKNVAVDAEDDFNYRDMLERLDNGTFLPKQRDSDNRVIPQQLYRIELEKLLEHAAAYLPMLDRKDESGFTAREKILSVFDFKIPYFVGPLGKVGENVWAVRKDGKIYPWNFKNMVDLDQSEARFIRRMTNTCTYLPGEDVLPVCSLLYGRFMVLNEINPIKINGVPIPVEAKQGLYTDLFMTRSRVTRKQIEDWLRSKCLLQRGDELSGIDVSIKASLRSYHAFASFLNAGILSEEDVEAMILRAAYSEDRMRLQKWLAENYPVLSKQEREYISKLKLKEFGRFSRKFLTGVYDDKRDGTGEARNLIDAMWETNETLMQLLSDRYRYRETVEQMAREFYDTHPQSLSERLEGMYVSSAVRRPILRALDITDDVVKALGAPPKKIFVEMARGGLPDQKGKRTKTRKQQLLELYQKIDTEDVRLLEKELEDMGELADNRLQSDALFLYYLQLGKSVYSGKPIVLSRLASGEYNVDHVYPQSLVKDDSVLNNKVLALSTENGKKGDGLVPPEWQSEMRRFWSYLRDQGFMTDEKYRRLTRAVPFSDEEKQSFINRQLVETRQSSKVVAELLKERYPDTEIVYVKAGIVSEFRQEYDIVKCRSLNDLHHARDAYLNVVVGNVYYERFSKRWFSLDQKYNIQVKKIFAAAVPSGEGAVWNGTSDIARVKKIVSKNAIHLTRYAFCRKSGQNGGLFDQNPLKAASGLIPLKKDLPTERYGGYSGATTSFFLLASFVVGKKRDAAFLPVDLAQAEKVQNSMDQARKYAAAELGKLFIKPVSSIELPFNNRPIKINTCLDLDGFRVNLTAGSIKDKRLTLLPMTPFLSDIKTERYVKCLESFGRRHQENPSLIISEEFDKITAEDNLALYELYQEKIENTIFTKRPGGIAAKEKIAALKESFKMLPLDKQVQALGSVHSVFGRAGNGIDFSLMGGGKTDCKTRKSLQLSNWTEYKEIRLIDASPAGLHEKRSGNLLELL
ncbi:MAG: type II CRISPR RNA-guided endonuclease Cas9 [Oscillospiraceae bacterium]|nr:type II CRISPR RNA-guided endonuclease Cas9 [Oscillospiraceae bacterium]